MKLLYGTSNQAKLEHMRKMLNGLDIEVIGLRDIGLNIDVDESGNTPSENAKIKAMAYYNSTGIPTFSCDSGLYIEGLQDDKQPGVHVRRINNKYLNDEELIKYYTNLISKLGKETRAKFKNAICLVLDEKHVFQYDGDDISDNFLIASKAHNKRIKGFPMDSISKDIQSGKYFVDMSDVSKNEEDITEGFKQFFMRTILGKVLE